MKARNGIRKMWFTSVSHCGKIANVAKTCASTADKYPAAAYGVNLMKAHGARRIL